MIVRTGVSRWMKLRSLTTLPTQTAHCFGGSARLTIPWTSATRQLMAFVTAFFRSQGEYSGCERVVA